MSEWKITDLGDRLILDKKPEPENGACIAVLIVVVLIILGLAKGCLNSIESTESGKQTIDSIRPLFLPGIFVLISLGISIYAWAAESIICWIGAVLFWLFTILTIVLMFIA